MVIVFIVSVASEPTKSLLRKVSSRHAEALVRPAEDERSLRAAVDAIAGLGIRLLAPDAALARSAARHRGRGISLADGFALATAERSEAHVASFDKRVRRALRPAGLRLCPGLR